MQLLWPSRSGLTECGGVRVRRRGPALRLRFQLAQSLRMRVASRCGRGARPAPPPVPATAALARPFRSSEGRARATRRARAPGGWSSPAANSRTRRLDLVADGRYAAHAHHGRRLPAPGPAVDATATVGRGPGGGGLRCVGVGVSVPGKGRHPARHPVRAIAAQWRSGVIAPPLAGHARRGVRMRPPPATAAMTGRCRWGAPVRWEGS